MASPLDVLSGKARERLEPRERPRWLKPMLATLTDEPFSDPGWIYERKLDGVRLLAFRGGEAVELRTRNRKDRTSTYPEVAGALAATEPDDFILDGEVVAFEGGRTSFSRLQGRMKIRDPDEARATGIAVQFYAFDLPHLHGHDLTALALRDRKRVLRAAFRFEDPVRFLPHRNAEGEAYLEEACAKGWEGLIAKRADSPYTQARSRDWLKLKCVNRQEFVVGGYTDPRGERTGFGALLLGVHEDGYLRYAGKVGTGYDRSTLERLSSRLGRLERETPPFADRRGLPRSGVHWVAPELVAEVAFTEWTEDGKLRHPRFVGLRTDKEPGNVVRERPA